MEVADAVEESDHLAGELRGVINIPLMDDSPRVLVSDVACSLSLEHWHSARALLRLALLPSALVVHRAQFEALTIVDLEMAAKNLETLSELLAEEADEATFHPTEIIADAEKCHEAQVAIDALIPKLRAAQPMRASARPASPARRASKKTI